MARTCPSSQRITSSAAARLLAPALAFAAVLALYVSLAAVPALEPGPAAPALEMSTPRCEVAAEALRARGTEAEAAARAKIARYPFAAAEGLAALGLLGEAEACYERAADASGRARAQGRRAAWRARLERDYRDHVLRYNRARGADRIELARADVAYLLALLPVRYDAFGAQLRADARRLELRGSSEERR